MAVDLTTTPAIGNATKRSDYVRLQSNEKAAAGAFAGVSIPLGGSLKDFNAVTSETDLDEGWEREVDGTHLAGASVILEVNVKRGPDALGGSVTVTVDLFNITAGAQVASSPVAIALTTQTRTHGKSVALTLATGINRYKARVKVSDAGKQCSAVAWIVIRGA